MWSPIKLSATTSRDPLTLPVWRKVAMLLTLSVAAFQGNFAAGAHLIAFKPISDYYHVSIDAIANTIGIGILGIGLGPLLWAPLAGPTGLGRRNTFILAWTIYVCLTPWLCFAESFNSFAAVRFLSMFCASVAQVLPAQQVGETFDRRYKGTAMSVWALFVTCGPVSTPIVGAGLLMIRPGPRAFRNIYYFVAVTAAVVWFMILFFVPETAYVGGSSTSHSNANGMEEATNSDSDRDHQEKSVEGGVEPTKIDAEAAPDLSRAITVGRTKSRVDRLAHQPWYYAIPLPLSKFLDVRVFLCSLFIGVPFGWTVGITILNPQVFEMEPWKFGLVQIGLVYMGAFAGTLVGKLLGGYVVDASLIAWRAHWKQRGIESVYAEQRLWSLLVFLPMGIAGWLLYGYGIGERMHWPVSVVAGQGMTYAYFNIISAVVQTYLVEVEPHAGIYVVTFVNTIKFVFAFGVPFFLPNWVLPSTHAFETAYIVQMVVGVVLCLGTVSLALFLRQGALKSKPGQLALKVDLGRWGI